MEHHRNIVVGVTAIAIVALFWGFFALAIVFASAVNPPEPSLAIQGAQARVGFGDYFSPGRLVVGVIVGVIGSLALWTWVDVKLYPASRFDRASMPVEEERSRVDPPHPTA